MSAQQVNLKDTLHENQKLVLCQLSPSKTELNLTNSKIAKKSSLLTFIITAKNVFHKIDKFISTEWERGEKIDNAIREARANQSSRFDHYNRHNW